MQTATRQSLNVSKTAVVDYICNRQPKKLFILNSEKHIFDSKTENSDKFSVTLQTKARKVHPVANPTPVAVQQLTYMHWMRQLNSFDFIKTGQKYHLLLWKANLASKIFLICLLVRAARKKYSQRVQELCAFARMHLFIHTFWKTDHGLMHAFTELFCLVLAIPVTAMTKRNASKTAKEDCLSEMSKRCKGRSKISFKNQLNFSQNSQSQQPQQ